ncbi:MAG: phage portal protein [Clostridia bacterium]|nr:phage portal protein [Clostridia bacterium]
MSIFDRLRRRKPQQRDQTGGSFALWLAQDGEECPAGYIRLSDNPEIQTGCLRIAEMLGSMTIHLMENTEQGDRRILNELSRLIDITPCDHMTRMQWMTAIGMNLLLYGKGNSVVVPHTYGGIIKSLEPIAASRVQFMPVGNSQREYRIQIDGQPRDQWDVLHFAYNPDPYYLWKGRGVTVTLKEVAANLKQAEKTKTAFLSSEWKPSVIVKVDSTNAMFQSKEQRNKFLESYIQPPYPGAPWLIPAEQIQVEQVKPLTLADLAIKDTVELDKRTVAAVLGVPPYLMGVGEFKRDEWNNFVETRFKTIALIIQQELTRGLITSPKWYIQLNYWSLVNYDLKSMSDVLLAGSDRGYVNGDEWRDRMHMEPAGLKEFRVLENYINYEDVGKQKKLVGNE